jgi:hypothetical protein
MLCYEKPKSIILMHKFYTYILCVSQIYHKFNIYQQLLFLVELCGSILKLDKLHRLACLGIMEAKTSMSTAAMETF